MANVFSCFGRIVLHYSWNSQLCLLCLTFTTHGHCIEVVIVVISAIFWIIFIIITFITIAVCSSVGCVCTGGAIRDGADLLATTWGLRDVWNCLKVCALAKDVSEVADRRGKRCRGKGAASQYFNREVVCRGTVHIA